MNNITNTRIQFLAQFAYVGSAFHGVQIQPQVKTVLDALKKRIEDAIDQNPRALFVAARTDRGVHALANLATFYVKPPIDVRAFIKNVGIHRNDGLYGVHLEQVDTHVHARGSSRGKTYRYTIIDGRRDENFNYNPFAWQIVPTLCVKKMHEAAQFMVGELDFSSLRGGGCQARSPIKKIFYIHVTRAKNGMIYIELFGNAFLRKMIRNLVGLLVEVGAGLRRPECILEILAQRSRSAAGVLAPAQGLCLMAVGFDLPRDSCKDICSAQ